MARGAVTAICVYRVGLVKIVVDIPSAGGENNVGLHEFHDMIVNQVYGILPPEVMVVVSPTKMPK